MGKFMSHVRMANYMPSVPLLANSFGLLHCLETNRVVLARLMACTGQGPKRCIGTLASFSTPKRAFLRV